MTNLTVSEALRLIELAREVDGKVLARFVSKVRISGSGCWEWTGSKDTLRRTNCTCLTARQKGEKG